MTYILFFPIRSHLICSYDYELFGLIIISYFQFVKRYPKFKYVTVSIYFIKQNFRLIKGCIVESAEEKHYWLEDKI
jgi:hypothetical protein